MDHDQLFKELLQTLLPEFMRAFFPEVAARIDWSHLTFVNTEFFTEPSTRGRRTVDVLAEVRSLAGEPELLLIHLEVESRPRPPFRKRMYRYYEVLRRKGLPVLPVAVFLSPGWGGVGTEVYSESVFDLEVLRFQFHRVSLPDVDFAALPRENPVTHGLAPILRGSPSDPEELLVQSLEGIDRTTEDEEQRRTLVNVLHAYVPLTPDDLERMRAKLESAGKAEVVEMLTVWERQGMRRTILRVVRARLGSVPGRLEALLDRLDDPSALDRIADLAARAESLEEFERSLAREEARGS